MKKLVALTSAFTTSLFLFSTPVLAQSPLGTGSCSANALDTAIGCIPIGSQNDFIRFFLQWALGIGGGVAFILLVVAAFQIMTSQGNPQKLQAGKELLTSAISGIILLIFSVFLLRFIGVDILKIPGFDN